MENYLTWNGGRIVKQTEKTVTLEIWLIRDMEYAEKVQVKINKDKLKSYWNDDE